MKVHSTLGNRKEEKATEIPLPNIFMCIYAEQAKVLNEMAELEN